MRLRFASAGGLGRAEQFGRRFVLSAVRGRPIHEWTLALLIGFTLTATPSYKGRILYRAQLPDCYRFVTSYSITGL